mmetsp:Transcript_19714/g.27892  ORF Transcript_19714/g.27892 Transcript_19714/m.27892 type:complete len:496 (+) Transcript_19714:126-1613(+)
MLVWRKIPLISVIIVYSCVGQQNLVTTAVFAFTTVVPCLDQGPIRPSTCCFAKPPPNSLFNLKEIEAFEEQLDQQTAEIDSSTSVEKYNDEFDEDDLHVDTAATGETENVKTFTVPPELNNKRIDAVIAVLEPKMSRSHCGTLVTEGYVHVLDGNHGDKGSVLDRKSAKIKAGTVLRIQFPSEEKPTEIVAQDLPLQILFEDEHMIVLNKAADMVVHPAAGNWDGTVVNALAYYLANQSPFGRGDFVGQDGNINADEAAGIDVDGTDGETVSCRPGIVHRLDKGTTGVLVVAKTKSSLAALSEAFAARRVKKTYLAVTVGNPGKLVKIDKPIGRHPIHRQRMRVVPDPHRKNSSGMAPKDRMRVSEGSPSQTGRRALSFVDTLAFDGKLSVVQVRIETGRTHQIRVHLQDRHTPIYGDDVYGLGDWNKRLYKTHKIERPLLHAYSLEIAHPVTGEPMSFQAPMADDMMQIARNIWPQGNDERPDLFPATTENRKE